MQGPGYCLVLAHRKRPRLPLLPLLPALALVRHRHLLRHQCWWACQPLWQLTAPAAGLHDLLLVVEA